MVNPSKLSNLDECNIFVSTYLPSMIELPLYPYGYYNTITILFLILTYPSTLTSPHHSIPSSNPPLSTHPPSTTFTTYHQEISFLTPRPSSLIFLRINSSLLFFACQLYQHFQPFDPFFMLPPCSIR